MTILKNRKIFFCIIITFPILLLNSNNGFAEDCLKKKGDDCVKCCLDSFVNVSPSEDNPKYAETVSIEGSKKNQKKESKQIDPKEVVIGDYDSCRKKCP